MVVLIQTIRTLTHPFWRNKSNHLSKKNIAPLRKQEHAQVIDMTLNKSYLTEHERFSLDLGHLAIYQAGLITSKGDLLQNMESMWGMGFDHDELPKNHVIYCLQQLWSKGSLDLFIQHTEYAQQVHVKDMVAFDLSQFVLLIHQAKLLELLNNEEAWGLLFLNSQRAQDCYESWDDFQQSYINGYLCHQAIITNQSPQALEQLKKNLNNDVKFTTQLTYIKTVWPIEPIFDQFKTVNSKITEETKCSTS